MKPYPFEEAIQFLKEYSWLYEERNIDYFYGKSLENFPESWVSFLKTLPYDKHADISSCEQVPESLMNFVVRATELSILSEPTTSHPEIDIIEAEKCIKMKKRHELKALVQLIRQKCVKHGITRVVDVGCGLGHLLNSIGTSCENVKLVGVECEKSLCSAGSQKYDGIVYENTRLQNASSDEDCRILSEEGERTALVSLHGCGDLQPLIINKFSNFPQFRNPLLITVPCCYHKMAIHDLPLSKWCLSNELRTSLLGSHKFALPPSALRLACQQRISSLSEMSMENHQEHERQFFYRAVLEVFLRQKGLHYMRLPRGATRLPLNIDDMTHFRRLLPRLGVSECDIDSECELFQSLLRRFASRRSTIEPFTTLQFYMQPVLESLILADRIAFIGSESNGLVIADAVPVFMSNVSPRNMALIAEKS